MIERIQQISDKLRDELDLLQPETPIVKMERNLLVIDLREQEIKELPFHIFQGLPDVRKVYLQHNKLKSLPS